MVETDLRIGEQVRTILIDCKRGKEWDDSKREGDGETAESSVL